MSKSLHTVKDAGQPLYGEPVFSTPQNRKIIEKWGRRSALVLEVKVPIVAIGATVDTAIWAEHKRSAEGDIVTFACGGVRGMRFDNDEHKDTFLAHVEIAAMTHPSYDTATDAAYKLLTDAVMPGSEARKTVAERPKLVMTSEVIARRQAEQKAKQTAETLGRAPEAV